MGTWGLGSESPVPSPQSLVPSPRSKHLPHLPQIVQVQHTGDAYRLAAEALNIMESRKITSIVIVDGANRVTGVVHLHDLW